MAIPNWLRNMTPGARDAEKLKQKSPKAVERETGQPRTTDGGTYDSGMRRTVKRSGNYNPSR